MNLGPAEILVVLVVALIVFGPKRLPDVGRQVGAAMRELRKMQDTVKGELDGVLNPDLGPTNSQPELTEPLPPNAIPAAQEPDHTSVPAPTEAVPRDAVVAGETTEDDGFASPGSFS
jgi:sec-independent protein translocase protein TatA